MSWNSPHILFFKFLTTNGENNFFSIFIKIKYCFCGAMGLYYTFYFLVRNEELRNLMTRNFSRGKQTEKNEEIIRPKFGKIIHFG